LSGGQALSGRKPKIAGKPGKYTNNRTNIASKFYYYNRLY